MIEKTRAMIEQAPIGSRWRHKVRGTAYSVIHHAVMQTNNFGLLLDGQAIVVYEAEHDHSVWVRPAAEFLDGRFERVQLP